MVALVLAAALAATLPQATPPADTMVAAPAAADRTASAPVILPFAIDSDPPAKLDLDGLVENDATDPGLPGSSGRRTPARQANDEALDQAFEEAIDMARFSHPN